MLFIKTVSVTKTYFRSNSPQDDDITIPDNSFVLPAHIKKVKSVGIRINHTNIVDVVKFPLGAFTLTDLNQNVITDFIEETDYYAGFEKMMKDITNSLKGGDTVRLIPQHGKNVIQYTAEAIIDAEEQTVDLDINQRFQILVDIYFEYDHV